MDARLHHADTPGAHLAVYEHNGQGEPVMLLQDLAYRTVSRTWPRSSPRDTAPSDSINGAPGARRVVSFF
jgi:hypothetical protein